MEMFPCRCHVGAARLWTQSMASGFSPSSTGVTRPSNLIRRAKYLGRLGGVGERPHPFAVILRFAAVEIRRDQRPKNARKTFPLDMETATDSRLLALRCFCRAHRDDRNRHRSTHCAHGRSARRNRGGAEKISRRGEWTAGGRKRSIGERGKPTSRSELL